MEFVENRADLERVAAQLSTRGRVYLDTEFESTRDGSTLCLLQASDGTNIYVIDTLRLADLAPLAAALGRSDCEWVIHAAQQDVPLLLGRLNLRELPPLFDTQVAWALLGPEYSVSLAYLQYRVLGVRAGKAHQADDWKRRPLPASQLEYAASDVRYLPQLRDLLGERLSLLGREPMALEASREVLAAATEPAARLSLDSFRNAWQLDPKNQAALRFLLDWHNALGPAERSRAPEPKVLLSIATRLPLTLAELVRLKGVPRGWAERHGQHLISGLTRASATADAGQFVEIEPPPYATVQDIRLEAWLQSARAEICAHVQVAPELAFPGRVLRQMRQLIVENGDVHAGALALQGWRKQLLSTDYLLFCSEHAPSWLETTDQQVTEQGANSDQQLRQISHDLRNPLSTIASALALLKREEHPERTARQLTVIERQLQQLARVVAEELSEEPSSAPAPQASAPAHSFTRKLETIPPSGPGLSVLVVDDNEDAATTLAELVTAWGHEVRTAHDGERALKLVTESVPDVIVLDIGLPGMNGYELAEQLREQRVRSALIALSGYGEKRDRERAERLGFAMHMVKPVDASLLKSAINAQQPLEPS